MSTETATEGPSGRGYRRSSELFPGFAFAPREERKTYGSGKLKGYRERQRRAWNSEISPVLASILRGAPTGGIGEVKDVTSCLQDVTTPWNAFMKCEITDAHLQLALAAMLGSSIWGDAIAEAARQNNMTMQEFLAYAFRLAEQKAKTLATAQDWENLYTNDAAKAKRRRRVSRKYRPAGQVLRHAPRAPQEIIRGSTTVPELEYPIQYQNIRPSAPRGPPPAPPM